jgi:general secretion pathway protein I
MTRAQCCGRQCGMSLLELLVALSIMAMAIGVLYRALGASVQNAGMLHEQQKALMLGQSLLAAKDAIAETGWNEAGESAGFEWQVRTSPVGIAQPGVTPLHSVVIYVRWGDGGRIRSIELQTLRPQRNPVVAVEGGQ